MVNYSNGKTYTPKTDISYSRRGMSLEEDLNDTNSYYLVHDIAVVYKKPTPITIVNVEYKSRSTAKITEAYFQTPSTTDYNGVYKGYYIDFEAKETHSRTALTLAMIHPHQLQHMRNVLKQNGIAFMIARFALLDETYFVPSQPLLDYIESSVRKSIPHSWFKENGVLIPYKYNIKVDYIKVLEEIIQEDKDVRKR